MTAVSRRLLLSRAAVATPLVVVGAAAAASPSASHLEWEHEYHEIRLWLASDASPEADDDREPYWKLTDTLAARIAQTPARTAEEAGVQLRLIQQDHTSDDVSDENVAAAYLSVAMFLGRLAGGVA